MLFPTWKNFSCRKCIMCEADFRDLWFVRIAFPLGYWCETRKKKSVELRIYIKVAPKMDVRHPVSHLSILEPLKTARWTCKMTPLTGAALEVMWNAWLQSHMHMKKRPLIIGKSSVSCGTMFAVMYKMISLADWAKHCFNIMILQRFFVFICIRLITSGMYIFLFMIPFGWTIHHSYSFLLAQVSELRFRVKQVEEMEN